MARLPQDVKDQDHFELFINDRDFLDHDFILLNKEKNNFLVGHIVLNDKVFLRSSQRLAWSS